MLFHIPSYVHLIDEDFIAQYSVFQRAMLFFQFLSQKEIEKGFLDLFPMIHDLKGWQYTSMSIVRMRREAWVLYIV